MSNNKNFQQVIKNNQIEIPIIQRDYAQGREDEKIESIREEFLGTIEQVLKNEKSLHLDFVYGSEINQKFIPLDGQQRLTTLFLLHWYFAKKENKDLGFLEKKFTYETRASSREFCEKLTKFPIDFVNQTLISSQIKDSTLFLAFWEKDPTVKSMLTMIDAIHGKFNTIENGFEKLDKISFEFFSMSDFNLTDDLYVKMNARGKQLTDFENFKAKFIQHIEKEKFEEDCNEIEKFSHKMDTIWLDLFWKYKGVENKIDKKIVWFFSTIAMQSIYIFKEDDRKISKDLIERLHGGKVQVTNFENEKSFGYLKRCLDLYSKNENDKKELKVELWGTWNKQLFQFSIKDSTYQEKALFFAQTQFLLKLKEEKKEFSDDTFQNWMRVVRNVINNSTIDSPVTYIGSIVLINELSSGCLDIYNFLNTKTIQSKFASKQVKQEILKAKLIVKDKGNKQVIFDTEDTFFCQGDISFAFYCIDFEKIEDNFDREKLKKVQKVIQDELLDENDSISNQLRAAFFTIDIGKGIGEFFRWFYWDQSRYAPKISWVYEEELNGRYPCHKYYLILHLDELKDYTKDHDGRDYSKRLVLSLIDTTLEQYLKNFAIPDHIDNWKKQIIQNPECLDYCQWHCIAVQWYGDKKQNSRCYLLPSTNATLSDHGTNPTWKILE